MYGDSSVGGKKLFTWANMVVKAGKGTSKVDIPTETAIGWNK